jgi:heme/copper-type cytochrome/quinol oxidase subunit 3
VFGPTRYCCNGSFGIPLLNTFILLTSGASVTWAHYAILLADRKQAAMGLWITILLAAIFGFQGYEYVNAGFTISDSVYGSVFYMLTGLHGFMFLLEQFLAFCLYRLNKGELRPDHHVGFELASLYFHWVDFVYLYLLLCTTGDHKQIQSLWNFLLCTW